MSAHCCHHHSAPAVSRSLAGRDEERSLLERLIGSMDRAGAEIIETAIGSKFLGIRTRDELGESVGLSSLLGAAPSEAEQELAASLPGKRVGEAARLLLEEDAFTVSLGAAALNAGFTPPKGQPDFEASRIMAEKTGDGEAVLIGDFPFTTWLRERVGKLRLLELQPGPDRTPPEEWDAALAGCKVLGLTGTTLLTRMMAQYLRKAPQAYTVIIGPTTPLSPALFEAGADVLAGCQVVDVDAVFAGVRKGLPFKAIKQLGVDFVAWTRD